MWAPPLVWPQFWLQIPGNKIARADTDHNASLRRITYRSARIGSHRLAGKLRASGQPVIHKCDGIRCPGCYQPLNEQFLVSASIADAILEAWGDDLAKQGKTNQALPVYQEALVAANRLLALIRAMLRMWALRLILT